MRNPGKIFSDLEKNSGKISMRQKIMCTKKNGLEKYAKNFVKNLGGISTERPEKNPSPGKPPAFQGKYVF